MQALSRADADLAEPNSVKRAVRDWRPDVVVNAAAYTAVDRAERERDIAFAVNAHGPGALAEECARSGALLIHYSTDYVFDGSSARPYAENDVTAPLNVYGESKAAGDSAIEKSGCAHAIFRTSWVYASRGSNFLRTMLKLASERKALEVIGDQIGAPTSARQIAEATTHALMRAKAAQGDASSVPPLFQGVFNLTAGGSTSWHGFAAAIFDLAGIAPQSLKAIPSANYPRPARRPKNSMLANDRFERTFGFRLPHWRIGVSLCVDEVRDAERTRASGQ